MFLSSCNLFVRRRLCRLYGWAVGSCPRRRNHKDGDLSKMQNCSLSVWGSKGEVEELREQVKWLKRGIDQHKKMTVYSKKVKVKVEKKVWEACQSFAQAEAKVACHMALLQTTHVNQSNMHTQRELMVSSERKKLLSRKFQLECWLKKGLYPYDGGGRL